MIKVIRNAKVYSPEFLGTKDLLILGDKIAAIEDKIKIDVSCLDVEEIDGRGKILTPGFRLPCSYTWRRGRRWF